MLRKIFFLMLMFSLFLGLNNCGGLKVREDYFEFRYNVEVVYTNVAEEGSNVTLYYILYDPIASGSNTVLGHIIMNKIGGNEARCYLPKVYVQREDEFVKHRVSVADENLAPDFQTGKNIFVQGAYELEIESVSNGTLLTFKMSKK